MAGKLTPSLEQIQPPGGPQTTSEEEHCVLLQAPAVLKLLQNKHEKQPLPQKP